MKTKLTQLILMLSLVVGMFSVGAGKAEALSESELWSSGNMPVALVYHWRGGGFGAPAFVPGLNNWNVSIQYSAEVKNNGLPLGGTMVAVGDVITLNAIPFASTDISWFGTGYSADSPYGHWLNNATAPAIELVSNDYVGRDSWSAWGINFIYDVYIPLSVNPPVITYDYTGGTASLSCDISGQNCTVTSPGSIIGNVNIGSTYGKFYYRYHAISPPPSPDLNDNTAMRQGFGDCTIRWGCVGGHAGSDYSLPIPAQTITFSLTAVSSNNNLTVPSVIPQPFNGSTSTAYPFTFTATDPDGDQVAYELDWNNDGSTDQTTAYGASGTSQSLSNPVAQWTIAGAYPFKVRAKDNQGGYSAWATPSVTLTSIIHGACGLASGFSFDTLSMLSPGLCASGTPATFLPTGTGWTWGCDGSGGGTSTLSHACTATTKTYTLTVTKNPLGTGNGNIADSIPTGTSIDSTIPRNTESVPYNSTRMLHATPTSSTVSWSGCTSVSGNDCTINNITAIKTVTATFTRLPEPGICGSSNTQSFESLNAGSSGLCSSGAVTGFSLSGTTYVWNCNGSFGSAIDVSCSASQIRNYNWRETAP